MPPTTSPGSRHSWSRPTWTPRPRPPPLSRPPSATTAARWALQQARRDARVAERHSRIASTDARKQKHAYAALADQLLVEMRRVLDRMLELETYNEVVSLLRDIISDQDQINKRTKEQQKDRLRSLFQE